MTRIDWANQSRIFETGLDQGVLYPSNLDGVPWIGLSSVNDKRNGSTLREYFMEGRKYLSRVDPKNHEMDLSAYTYPDEFEACVGSIEIASGFLADHQQPSSFGLTYRTLVGNDLLGTDYGSKIHFIYNATALPSDWTSSSLSDSTGLTAMTWSLSTIPIDVEGIMPTAHFVLNTTGLNAGLLFEIECILYGSPNTSPRLPHPSEIVDILRTDVSGGGVPNSFTANFGASF